MGTAARGTRDRSVYRPRIPGVNAIGTGVHFPETGHGPYRLLRGLHAPAVRDLARACADPRGAQEARLRAVLAEVSDTEQGRVLGLRRELSLDAYRDTVPVRTHADLLPLLDRVAAGEIGVLTRSPVRMLLETSGTTGRPKWLPVTDPWARSVGAAQSLWVLSMLRDDEALARGSALSIVSAAEHARSSGGLPIGANTGRMFLAQPWYVRLRAPVPYAVYCLEDPEIRAYGILRHALAQPVRSWSTANPSTILLYCRRMVAWWDDLAQDCADGTFRCGPAAALPDAARRRLGRLGGWGGFPRARLPAEPLPARAWSLRRVSCWTGGSAPFFLEKLATALGAEVPVREAGVNASEGAFGVSVDDLGPIAWLAGHVLEFIDAGGRARWAWELEEGAEYRLVVSTEAGLLRYDMGDLVRVVGWAGGAPRIVFVRKAGNFLNATGEKVTEDQIVAAARAVAPRAVGVSVSLGWGERPWFRLAVEMDDATNDLANRFDVALRGGNLEYASKRDTDRLAAPVVHLVPPGTFTAWKLARVRAGAPDAQVKDPIVLESSRWDALVAGGESPS